MDTIQVNGQPYTVTRLLGKGKGGYSYLAQGSEGPVVVKQIHHEPCSYYQFGDKLQSELRDYRTLSALGIPMPRLLAVDEAQERLVKQYIPGPTVLEQLRAGTLPPQAEDQMLAMCRLLYPAGLNIDYFPTNFILWDGVLYYVDYECNPYDAQWDFSIGAAATGPIPPNCAPGCGSMGKPDGKVFVQILKLTPCKMAAFAL